MARRRRARRGLVVTAVAAAAAFLAAPACSVDDLDLAGRACPCVGGFVCDLASNTCVTALPDGGPGSRADVVVPAVDGGGDAVTPPAARVSVAGLTATWAAPSTLRWDWTLSGNAADFRAYEIIVGSSAENVDKRLGVTLLTTNTRAELGPFDARSGKTAGPVAMWTLTDQPSGPATPQFVRVQVTDVDGVVSQTPVVGTTSGARPTATTAAILFNGAERTAQPAGEYVYRNPTVGDTRYQLVTACGGPARCAKRADLVALALDLQTATDVPLTSALFDAAYLDFQIDGTVALTSFDTSVGLVIGAPATAQCKQPGSCRYVFTGFTQRTGQRTRIQVPLRELANATGKLTFAALQQEGLKITGFTLAGTWDEGRAINLYDARIRW